MADPQRLTVQQAISQAKKAAKQGIEGELKKRVKSIMDDKNIVNNVDKLSVRNQPDRSIEVDP